MPIAVVDQERLFEGSLYGRRIFAEIDARTEALATENRRIEAQLTAEEQALTDERATLTLEAFRQKARAFDAKVESLRSAQDAKASDLARFRDEAQRDFFNRVIPILQRLLADRGAAVLLDRRAVLTAVDDVDITAAAIDRIDRIIGDGAEDAPAPEDGTAPAPDGTPGPVPEDGTAAPVPGETPAPVPGETSAPVPGDTAAPAAEGTGEVSE